MLGLEQDAGNSIVDNYIMVVPDDARKGLVFLGNKAASYKFGNIKMDLKRAIMAGFELMASVSCPKSLFNYLQLVIMGALFIQKATRQDIGKNEAYIVYYLHLKNGYEIRINEDSFIGDFLKWHEEKYGNIPALGDIENAVENLYRWKVLDISDGEIWLREIVVGVME